MASRARIYLKPKNAMQSGAAGRDWMLEFEPSEKRRADPLMGWIGSGDTLGQLRMHFATKEEAIAYAEREGIAYDLEIPRERRVKPKSYSDNFKFGRAENWTH
ncbi:MAG: ETC complex I subunit [Acetobacteraceae bacterium]|nr:ETC complex I subunit [Acetobacteraceae bacterium]